MRTMKDILVEMSRTMRGSLRNLRRREITGGIFGSRRFALVSFHCIRGGLDAVSYMVAECPSGTVLSLGDDKATALSQARDILTNASTEVEAAIAEVTAEAQEEHRAHMERELEAKAMARAIAKVKSVPKRRREIFEKSGGKCHYCATPLTLDGKWHIEHMQPRALLGANDRSNLVASCVPCNMKKRDQTAEEFIAQRSA